MHHSPGFVDFEVFESLANSLKSETVDLQIIDFFGRGTEQDGLE